MLSTAANSVWQSSTTTKGSGNWSQYNVNITGAPYKFNVNTATTTTTSLSIHDAINFLGINLQTGDPILLSNNGTTFVAGQAGSLSTVGGADNTAVGQTFANAGAPSSFPSGNFAGNYISTTTVSPDGRYAYASTNQSPYNMTYWTLSTPFNFSTAVATGKFWTPPEAATVAWRYCYTFKNDGTIIYVASVNSPSKINAYPLSTAWDISTASSNPIASVSLFLPTASSYWGAGVTTGISCMKFSPDGTKLIIQNGSVGGQSGASWSTSLTGINGNFAIYTLSTPWNISTCTTTTTNLSTRQGNTYTGAGGNYSYCLPFIISPDGLNIIGFSGNDGSYGCAVSSYLYIFSFKLTTAWTLNTGYTYLGVQLFLTDVNSGQISNIFASWDSDGSSLYVQPYIANSLQTKKSGGGTKNTWTKTNIDITSFGFATAPNVMYYAPPTLNAQTDTNPSRINMYNREVYMNTASATTTTANLALYGSGVIAAGDTILANGTTSIIVSSVVESSLANVNMGLNGYIYSTSKNKTVDNAYTNFVLSPDGTTMITGGLTPVRGLYMYKLSTPFDISTAIKTNISLSANSSSGSTNNNTVPFDISPDGKKLITCGDFIGSSPVFTGSMAVYQYTLTQAWNIGTAVFTGVFYNTNITNAGGQNRAMIVKWGPLGNSVIVGFSDSSNTNTTLRYRTLTVSYDLSTAANNGITSFAGANGPSLHYNASGLYFTPDGKKMLATGAGGGGTDALMSFPITSANDASTISSTTVETFALTPLGLAANTTYGGVSASPDGTKLYVIPSSATAINQYNLLLSNTTNYFVTYPTQSGKPSSMYLPDRSSQLTLTMTRTANGNVTFASANTLATANNLAIKITSPVIGTNLANVLINTWNA